VLQDEERYQQRLGAVTLLTVILREEIANRLVDIRNRQLLNASQKLCRLSQLAWLLYHLEQNNDSNK